LRHCIRRTSLSQERTLEKEGNRIIKDERISDEEKINRVKAMNYADKQLKIEREARRAVLKLLSRKQREKMITWLKDGLMEYIRMQKERGYQIINNGKDSGLSHDWWQS